MNRLRLIIAVAALAAAAAPAAAATPKFRMSLATANAGNDPFGTGVADKGRLYAGEPIVASVTGTTNGREPLGLDNDQLVDALNPCLLAGADHPEIAAGGSLDCLQLGIQWSRTAVKDSAYDLDAKLVGTGGTIPPGDYTLVVVNDNPDLLQALGVTGDVRSNALVMVVAAPATEKQALASLLREANQARADEDWATAAAKAAALLAIYDRSVYALVILGDAALGQDDKPAALNAYEAALEVLTGGADTYSPELAEPATKERWTETLEIRIDGILHPPEEE